MNPRKTSAILYWAMCIIILGAFATGYYRGPVEFYRLLGTVFLGATWGGFIGVSICHLRFGLVDESRYDYTAGSAASVGALLGTTVFFAFGGFSPTVVLGLFIALPIVHILTGIASVLAGRRKKRPSHPRRTRRYSTRSKRSRPAGFTISLVLTATENV